LCKDRQKSRRTPAHLVRRRDLFATVMAELAASVFVYNYYTAAEGLILALEEVDGDITDLDAFWEALSNTEFEAAYGPISLDENRQAISNNYVKRVVPDADGDGVPEVETIRRIPDVDQSFGGTFTPDSPAPDRSNPPFFKWFADGTLNATPLLAEVRSQKTAQEIERMRLANEIEARWQADQAIGSAFITYLKAKRIGVSRDMRVSSPALAAAARHSAADHPSGNHPLPFDLRDAADGLARHNGRRHHATQQHRDMCHNRVRARNTSPDTIPPAR